jgi:hypothetical protein
VSKFLDAGHGSIDHGIPTLIATWYGKLLVGLFLDDPTISGVSSVTRPPKASCEYRFPIIGDENDPENFPWLALSATASARQPIEAGEVHGGTVGAHVEDTETEGDGSVGWGVVGGAWLTRKAMILARRSPPVRSP